jgi:hypothetical protein
VNEPAKHEIDPRRIVHTFGQAVRYRDALTYKPSHQPVPKSKQDESASDRDQPKACIELYRNEKLAGYIVPHYEGV